MEPVGAVVYILSIHIESGHYVGSYSSECDATAALCDFVEKRKNTLLHDVTLQDCIDYICDENEGWYDIARTILDNHVIGEEC